MENEINCSKGSMLEKKKVSIKMAMLQGGSQRASLGKYGNDERESIVQRRRNTIES